MNNKVFVRTVNDWSNRYGLGTHVNIITTLEGFSEAFPGGFIHVRIYDPVTKKSCLVQKGQQAIKPCLS